MQETRKTWGLIGTIIAGFTLFSGLSGLLSSFFLPRFLGPEQEMLAAMLAAGSLLIITVSTAWLIIGLRAWHQEKVLGFPTSRRIWLTILSIWLLLAVLGLLLPEKLHFTTPFALIHFAMILLPALLLLIFAGLAAGREKQPNATLLMAAISGGVTATLPAFLLEMISLLLVALLVGGVAALFPGGQSALAELQSILQHWYQSQPTQIAEQELLRLLSSPIVLAMLLLILTIITPLVEESVKAWLALVLSWRYNLAPRTAFLLGAASGIGFAILEGSLNSIMGLGQRWAWAAGVGMRLPATAMHAFTSGLIGLGWGYFHQRRHRWLLPTTYLSALLIHGLWNFSTVGLVASSAWLTQSSLLLPSSIVSISSALLLLLLIVLAPLGLVGTPLWLRKRSA